MVVLVYNKLYLAETSLRRLLVLKDNIIHSPEAIVVDDCSREGTGKYHSELCRTRNAWWCKGRQRNMVEGAALRTPLAQAIGDISIVHDADLEYSPVDIPCVRIARYLSAPLPARTDLPHPYLISCSPLLRTSLQT